MKLPRLRDQLLVGVALTLTMITTRGFHTMFPFHWLDASWAVFFLAGVYLSARWVFPVLCAITVLIDWLAISWGGVSSFCITPAYAMLFPAYASLWLGGRWYAQRHCDCLETLPMLCISVILSAMLAELFSSGGFYFIGGRFTEPTLMGFLERFFHFFPRSLSSMVLYVSLAATLNVAWVYRRHIAQGRMAISNK